MKRLPNLSNLKQLEELNLSFCSGLTEIRGLEELTALRELDLTGCNSSLLTEQLFQIYSAFGHEIVVHIWPRKFPNWINQTTSLNLPPNMSHNYLGMILCFKRSMHFRIAYSVETSTGNIWNRDYKSSSGTMSDTSFMILVPRSTFLVTDADHTIEFKTSDFDNAVGIHLLYNPGIRMSDEYDSINVNELELDDPTLQNIFLDIACFFIRWKRQEVVNIMETCYTFVSQHIDILKARGLLTISNQDELEMHDQLQRIGRKIAQNNSPDEPGKHSRLWLSLDIYDVMENHTGTIAIEGIVCRKVDYKDALEGKSFTSKTFKRMSKLRFLYLRNVNLIGRFEQTLEDLRWLCWDECPLKCLPYEFYPQKLVILELPRSKLRTIWEPNMVSHVFDKLKTLNMSYSQALTTTPDFTKLPCLETLNFEYCESLAEVHISVGSLVRLSSLNLHDCGKLETLPHTICNLKALKCLNIGGCCTLNALPSRLGNIESLTDLIANELNVWKLPDSIGHLSKLVELRLGCNKNLETLPETICNLSTLEILDISGSKRLKILPDQLWKLTKLRELDLGGATGLEKLPDIESSQLDLSLKILDLSESSLASLPFGISQLSALEDLDLTNCGQLLSIPNLLPNMKWIYAGGCTSMERLPNLSNLKQLEELDLADCSGLTVISGLEELTCIRVLHLEGCTSALLAYTFTKRLFQIYFGFGHLIEIYALQFMDWISQSENSRLQYCPPNGGVSGLSLKLPPNISHNLLGMILCFEGPDLVSNEVDKIDYSVENTRTHFILTGSFNKSDFESLMVIVPISIFPIGDGVEEIKLTSYTADIHGIHLLYQSEDDSTTVDVEDERTNPSESDSDVNEEVERSYPSKRLKHLECDTHRLSL